LFERALKNAQPYLAWFEESVSRQGVLPDSIAEMLFKAEDAGELDEGVASNVVRSFVGGGTDSTIAGIGFTLHQLAKNPAQWERVRSDPAKVKAAFEEGIRHETPFQVTYRTTVSGASELSGVRLDGDVKVGVFMGAANRDPRQFANADSFDVDRPQLAGNHVALGTGIHACIGQMIARGESEALLGALCKRVTRLELTAPASYRPRSSPACLRNRITGCGHRMASRHRLERRSADTAPCLCLDRARIRPAARCSRAPLCSPHCRSRDSRRSVASARCLPTRSRWGSPPATPTYREPTIPTE